MLWIETRGSWRDMGRQYGETLKREIAACMEHYAGWLLQEPDRYAPAVAGIRRTIETHCPALLDETKGMADATGVPEPLLLGFRFFNELRKRATPGCSAVFLAEAKEGPLLGRNCDLSPTFEAETQLCRTCRPDEGTATLFTTYVGLTGGVGLNEHGLATGGASAHTTARYGDEGLPAAVLCHRLLNGCRDVAQATEFMAEHAFLGKSCNLIAADETGASVLFELVPGRPAFASPRAPDRNWQACTNFFVSGKVPIAPETAYLHSAYARYGRVVHQLAEGLMEHSMAGLQHLLTDIAQPGLCITEEVSKLRTAYSQVTDIRARKMHLAPGHPADTAFQEVSL